MKIVGVCACTVGIAHTYIALTEEEIAAADIVILAIDIKIADRDRFEGKRIIQVSTDVAIKSPNKLIEKAKQVVEAA